MDVDPQQNQSKVLLLEASGPVFGLEDVPPPT